MHNDETLWKGLMKGDKEMFLALYRKYYHSLLFIGLKEIKDASLVKDAIQQQFLYLWEKRETIHEAKNVRSYLITSFLRKLTSDWKKLEKTGNLQVAWSNHSEEPLPTPEESLIVKDGQRQLYKLLMYHINALPARQKELVILKFYEGLTYEEIVQKTGLAHRSVYNKIHEALKKLKLELEKEHTSYGKALSVMLSVLIASTPFIKDIH
ncbi:MAG TPA: sigma-70 family RNA polymerase sigma factor [Chitinophagaceae bacterium]|nr:sigma-70 family RNA polymerase sigma factor [Chitinophagaceae bacterium]